MLRWLNTWRLRMLNAWCRVFYAMRAPTRVGVLDTGELILVADTGQAQIISRATTELVRVTLDRHAAAINPPILATLEHRTNRRKPLRVQSRA